MAKFRYLFLTAAFASLFFSLSISIVEAQTGQVTPTRSTPTTGAPTQSISGDDLCGSLASGRTCTINDLWDLIAQVSALAAALGGMLIVIIMVWRVVYSGLLVRIFKDDPGAIANASKNAGQALVGFGLVMVVIGGGLAVILQAFGAQPWTLGFFDFLAFGFVEHAYAQQYLPSTTRATNLYSLVIDILNTAMRFFIYPAIIVAWVASGFKFVYSRGNPEGLKTARAWLYATLIVTAVVFTIQGFILALTGTVNRILPTAGSRASRGAQTQGRMQGASSVTPQARAAAAAEIGAQAQATGARFPQTFEECRSMGFSDSMCRTLYPAGMSASSENCGAIASETARERCFAEQPVPTSSASNGGCDPSDASCDSTGTGTQDVNQDTYGSDYRNGSDIESDNAATYSSPADPGTTPDASPAPDESSWGYGQE